MVAAVQLSLLSETCASSHNKFCDLKTPDMCSTSGGMVHCMQAEAGKLVFGGAYNPNTTDVGIVEGALFIFKDATPADIEAFVAADPYVVGGLVPSWSIKPYNVVVEPN